MTDLMECTLCGYRTVRCGMTNHLKTKHNKEYLTFLTDFYAANRDPRREVPNELAKFVGKVTHWSKDRNQTPQVKAK